jgi:hypothetical protein
VCATFSGIGPYFAQRKAFFKVFNHKRSVANHCEWRRTTANGGKRSRTAAKDRERLFAIRFLRLRMARIVVTKINNNFD